MSGFARRCAWALLAYLCLWAFVWLLQFAGAWSGPLRPISGAVTVGFVLLPLLLLSWALASRPIFAPFVAAALGVLVLLIAAVVMLVLLRIYDPVLGYKPDDEFGTLLFGWFRIAASLGSLAPFVVLIVGTLIYLSRFRLGRVVAAVGLLMWAGWMLSPKVDRDALLMIQTIVQQSIAPQQVAGSEPTPSHAPVSIAERARVAATATSATAVSSPCPSEAISLLEGYLEVSYNPAVGLYREAPNVAPEAYWVYSDGYLAGADISRWDVPVLTKWTILVDRAVVDEIALTYSNRDLDLGDGVRSEVPNPDVTLPDWAEYADRLLFAAINAQNAGNWTRAEELIATANVMWNGKGMADKFHQVTGMYQTYHVALYYYATGRPEARDVLLSLQEKDPHSNRYGGIYTEYGEDGRPFPGTDTNIETSATTLRALKGQCRVASYLPLVAASATR